MDSVGSPRPLRILVVDDDCDTVETMALCLRLCGRDVRTAGSGSEALVLAKSYQPDVVLLDVAMSGTDGWEIARRLRQDPNLRGMYVICVTGLARDADRQRSLDAGCDEHWAKPMDLRRLEKLLDSLQGRIEL